MRLLSFVLLALLLAVQAELWLGKGSLPRVLDLREELAQAQARNAEAAERNERLAAEVDDLREGLEIVEEKARYELGMVKPNEIYVHIDPRTEASMPVRR
jgi:cell division protein FtsB